VNLGAGEYSLFVQTAGYVDASQEFTLSFSESSADAAVESEVNDTASDANTITVSEPMTGRISSASDVDFYRLVLSTTKTLDVAFDTALSAPGSYELSVMIGENVINHVTIPGSGNSAVLPIALFPGTYFLRVTGEGVSSSNDYTLAITEVTGVTREFEPNNSKAFANGLSPSTEIECRLHGGEDLDYFGVTQESFDYFGVSITPVTAGIDYHVKAFNAEDGLILDFSTQNGEPAYGELYLWPGNYFVEVTGEHAGEYNLIVEGGFSALKELVKLAVLDAPETVDVDQSVQLELAASYTDGSVVDLIPSQATWTVSDETVATVSDGVVTGHTSGAVSVFASYGGQMAKADLRVGAGSAEAQTYGNLILVAGGGVAETNTLRESTQYLDDMVYARFLGRGFEEKDIYYFNPISWHDINGDGYSDPVVSDESPTVAELLWAIETWAVEQPSTGPLFLGLINHGGIDTFEVFPGEIMTATQLADAITIFQNGTGRDVIVLMEACKSGSFVDDLAPAGSNCMVVTCTDEGNAYLELKGRISFTQFFMDSVFGGDTFRQSFFKTKERLTNCGKPYSLMVKSSVWSKNSGNKPAMAKLPPSRSCERV
jgi:hypothetical protein